VSKRNYRANLAFVESAFEACWRNAQALVGGAKLLLDNELHAQALSLSVLALEELGKLFCIDGLLFARTDDHKAETFAKSLKSHSVKLDALVLFPLLLGNLASVDPRRTEARFAQALATSITDLKNRGNVVFSMLVNASFRTLDQWKQTGFYAQPKGNTFTTPASAVTPEIANAVYELAWRAETTLDFLLKGGNLKRYIDSARLVRAKLTEADHRKLEEMGEAMFVTLFGEAGKEADV
jgi:AbiV family abortive infection protein